MTDSQLAPELQQAAVLQEFQALREEMMGAINARLWGTLTYVAIAGGVGALFSASPEPALLVVLIFSAVPLLWHTASRERARVRIGAYIKEVIEPRMGGGIAWESYLFIWREKFPGGGNWKRQLDQWWHILGLTGIHLIVVSYCVVTLVSSGRTAPKVLGIIGAGLCLHALLLFKGIYNHSGEYDAVFREIALYAGSKEARQEDGRRPGPDPADGAAG
jgi:hypothetical protein